MNYILADKELERIWSPYVVENRIIYVFYIIWIFFNEKEHSKNIFQV